MAVPPISTILRDLVASAATAAGQAEALPTVDPAVPTGNPAHGDYQSNHAFRLAKATKSNPRAMAETLRAAMPAHPGVAKVEVAGPGFLNFFLHTDWLADQLAAQVRDPVHGIPQTGAGQTVIVDYSSPNVAKRMHVGHMRSTLIGDALARLHRAAGWTVVADNHIGDWGTQFGKLIIAWRRWLDVEAFEADPIGELERLYVHFGEVKTPELEAEARAETAKLQRGDPENLALWHRFIDVSMAEFNTIYERLDVHFDEMLGESAYNEALPGIVAEALDRGVAERSEGAVVIKFSEGDRGLADTVLVIQKADGASLYGTTDLATIRYRVQRWHPTRMVYVTDTRQQLHFRQVFAAAARLGLTGEAELIHTWFGMLKLSEGLMSTRKGNVIRLVDLLDEGVRRARAVVDDKSPELPEAERGAIAEAVGIGAIRYADLSQNPQSDVVFAWDKMLSLEGNTAPYLLYSYARCRSLQRKGEIEHPSVEGLAATEPLERELLTLLVRFPEMVGAALEASRPNLLCDYLFSTANAFNRFYYELPVLTAVSLELRQSRLALVEASASVLQTGLGLLGVPTLERM